MIMSNWLDRIVTNEKLYQILREDIDFEKDKCSVTCWFYNLNNCDLFGKNLKCIQKGLYERCDDCLEIFKDYR